MTALAATSGGHVFLEKDLHKRIVQAAVFQAYSVQRYWLHDFPDEDHSKPISRRDVQHLTLHRHYGIAISFHSASEAIAFKLKME